MTTGHPTDERNAGIGAETTTFLQLVKRKQQQIVLDVAEEYRGNDFQVVENVLRQRLRGLGAQAGEIARWANSISSLPAAGKSLDA
ncbi:MAG TPA: hypothetical protein VGF17_18720 [Phytomonospora sp.]